MSSHTLKTFFTNCFTTLSLNIIALAIVSSVLKAPYILSATIFECLIAHIFIHTGRMIINYLNIKNDLLELTANFSVTLLIVIIFGCWFNWFASVPIWICILIALFVYIIGCIFYETNTNRDIDFINKKLELRNHKEVDNN